MNIAIIPARSGSVRLKNKNILDFHGVPMLIHTVYAAIESKMFDIVHVSTDSEEIASIVRQHGLEVPILRSKKNSNSNSSSISVVDEVVEYYEGNGIKIDLITLLQPTSPLRGSIDIIKSLELMNTSVFSVVSVTETVSNNKLINAYLLSKSHLTNDNFRAIFGEYIINGAIYIIRRKDLELQVFYNQQSLVYEMSPECSIDIDNYEDYLLALDLFHKCK